MGLCGCGGWFGKITQHQPPASPASRAYYMHTYSEGWRERLRGEFILKGARQKMYNFALPFWNTL